MIDLNNDELERLKKRLNNYNNFFRGVNRNVPYSKKDIFEIFRFLLFPKKLYFKYGEGSRRNILIDLDDRSDHVIQINHLLTKYKLDYCGAKKDNYDLLIKSSFLRTWLVFFRISPSLLIYAIKNKKPIIPTISFCSRYSIFYSLAVNIKTALKEQKLRNILSLSFQLYPGFSDGIKYSTDDKVNIISIQHGLISQSVKGINDWFDYDSDFFVAWNDNFHKYISDRINKKCILLSEGKPYNYKFNYILEIDIEQKNNILFVSSLSNSASLEVINNELMYINLLIGLSKKWSKKLIVRLHPSITSIDNIPFPVDDRNFDVSLSTSIRLEEQFDSSSVVFTCNSTAIIKALELSIPCSVFSYITNNILMDIFPRVPDDVDISIGTFISQYTLSASDLKLLYGKSGDELLMVLSND